MHDKDDEEEELRRQEAELAGLSPLDRLYGHAPLTTAAGFDDARSNRRTGRVAQLNLRMQLRARAIVDAIVKRDKVTSHVVLFELMLEAYQQVHGPISEDDLPDDDELIRRYIKEKRKRDGQ